MVLEQLGWSVHRQFPANLRFPDSVRAHRRDCALGLVADWLGKSARIEIVPIAHDTPDWMLGSYWAHPERVLDPVARAATSGFARMPEHVVSRVVATVDRDLKNGTWETRHGALRRLHDYDVGLRLIVADIG